MTGYFMAVGPWSHWSHTLQKRKRTIVHLIQLFQSEDFHLINKITNELHEYKPIEKPVEKTKFQKFLENRLRIKIIVAIFGTVGIILASVLVAHFLSQNPDASYTDFITWSIAISGIGLGILYSVLIFWKNK